MLPRLGNFEVIFIKFIDFSYKINMMGVAPTWLNVVEIKQQKNGSIETKTHEKC